MRRLFLLLCLVVLTAGSAEAAFSYEKTTVKVFADVEGDAHIIERIAIKIEGEDAVNTYDNNIAITNDIASWKSRTGIKEIRYHINPNIAPISSLRVIPQPKKRLSLINPSYEGVLQIEYDVKGLFNKTQIRARTYEYTIKPSALSFSLNAKGDIVLEENDYLYITMPAEVRVRAVDPLSQNLDVLSKDDKEFFWKGKTILEDFSFVYEYEISLRKEVEDYFITIKDRFYGFMSSEEGTYLTIMVLLIVISYLLLKYKVKGNE